MKKLLIIGLTLFMSLEMVAGVTPALAKPQH
ncbi:hypothetical protein METH109765_06965 [Mesobacillus thioparans]